MIDTFLLGNTYSAEIVGDYGCHPMIRHSCSMLAYSLLLTNEESHKRQPSSERLLGV